MALQDVAPTTTKDSPKPETTYYKLGPLAERKEGVVGLLKEDMVEGYYYESFSREGLYGTNWNHVLIKEDGTHHVVNGATDIDKTFASDKVKPGLFTRLTYLGKVPFEYDMENGKKGKASAHKARVQQDPDRTCSFEGEGFMITAALGGVPPEKTAPKAEPKTETTTIDTSDVPF